MSGTVANEENLQPVSTKKEARERGRAGGIKSGEVRRAKKTNRELLEKIAKLPIMQEKMKEQLLSIGLEPDDATIQMAMNVAIVQQALKGNIKAYEGYRDTVGEKPVDVVQNIEQPTILLERPKKDG